MLATAAAILFSGSMAPPVHADESTTVIKKDGVDGSSKTIIKKDEPTDKKVIIKKDD
jgi:hypothetical protein